MAFFKTLPVSKVLILPSLIRMEYKSVKWKNSVKLTPLWSKKLPP